eukprot:CAMPEP_0183318524 /NCGR_PEP_ID=MMETSP0160_2-20130417/60970_1 /TAXON_ID=2839 ORGANISM="Odontella Sinensis, Strain Grunow 1884" /NCGR_SAMPLE_ID=MMETSP0160_2 /ASSEMBLY_ACC=CAM_ASM_000250 /LENGTH=69 /DNA_ID=CAMNT_0025484805 /DNA_START=198 /DNA_END=404 /DNA_ORIENTATION=+
MLKVVFPLAQNSPVFSSVFPYEEIPYQDREKAVAMDGTHAPTSSNMMSQGAAARAVPQTAARKNDAGTN